MCDPRRRISENLILNYAKWPFAVLKGPFPGAKSWALPVKYVWESIAFGSIRAASLYSSSPESHITMSQSEKKKKIRRGHRGGAARYLTIHRSLHANWKRAYNAQISKRHEWMRICIKLSLRDVINQKWMRRREKKKKKRANEQTRRGRGGVNYPFRFLDSGDNHLLFSDKRRADVNAVNPPLWAAAWIWLLCCDYL